MPSQASSGRSDQTRRRVRLWTDVPVMLVLVLCSATVAVAWAHVTAGFVLIGLVGVHLCTRRRQLVRSRRARHVAFYGALFAAASAMAVTGLLRWAGVPAQYVWHGGISYLVLGLVTVHLWLVRSVLWARIRRLARSGRIVGARP
ncbi:hypothetical protein MOQ72_42585 [Saccharopolyspora sp. K220]|uniref:hypothetical protein n=1 Tax=Saccharopolyspora soli TaxID=2926618 RepID=UPI001F57F50E|nr:hypothetical protein [Saccharopolyspora soli]MCI2424105.1 hypothetical protein [Saccharopolyspora soli]